MKRDLYLLDTHALIFWYTKKSVSKKFLDFFDHQDQLGNLLISPISIWEIAFLVKKGRLKIDDLSNWIKNILNSTNLTIIQPGIEDFIKSTQLPDYHQDPFDRLLIIQAQSNNSIIVSKDKLIKKYSVKTFWI